MNVQAVIYLALSGAAAFFVVKHLFRVDSKVEDLKRQTIKVSAWCRSNGMPILCQLLENFAVGDKSGMAVQARDLWEVLSDEERSRAVVDQFLKTQLNKRLETAEGREELVAYIEKRLNIKIPRELLNLQPASLTVKSEAKDAPLEVGPSKVKVTETSERETEV